MNLPAGILALLDGMTLPEWAHWLAQDADGSLWAFEAEPLQSHNGWYENEVGRRLRVAKGTPPDNWQSALFRLS